MTMSATHVMPDDLAEDTKPWGGGAFGAAHQHSS